MTEFFGTKIAIANHKGSPALFTFKNTTDRLDSSVTSVKIDVKDKKGTIASWGKNNDYPQKVFEAARKNSSVISGLRINRKTHFGNGLILMKEDTSDSGKKDPTIIPLKDAPEIRDFFVKSQMKRTFKEIITDLEWLSIAFPEYILSNNFQTINRVKRQKAAWCRFELMNEENGLIEHVYISERFGKTGTVNLEGDFVEKVPLIDSYWSADEVKEYCKANKILKFIRPVFYPLLDEAFYPKSEWHSIVESGWLEVANSVPEIKKNIFKNQATIKYIIEVDERYFENIYQNDWKAFKPEQRIEIRENLIDSINDGVVGNEKAGKAIQSMMYVGDDKKQYSAIKITAIEDKLKDGSYLPEASAANSEILVALGVDSAIIGGAGIPGGSLGAGSGSDKREAFIILSALKRTDRDTTLEIFEFIQQYNGWDPEITATFENTILTTLDENPTGTKTVAS